MVTNPRISQKTKELLDNLSGSERDDIYRALWFDHVAEDVTNLLEENESEINDDIVSAIAERYVYDGDYDCNLDYWTNLRILLIKSRKPDRKGIQYGSYT